MSLLRDYLLDPAQRTGRWWRTVRAAFGLAETTGRSGAWCLRGPELEGVRDQTGPEAYGAARGPKTGCTDPTTTVTNRQSIRRAPGGRPGSSTRRTTRQLDPLKLAYNDEVTRELPRRLRGLST
jgi:hypothetical protein